MCTWKYLSVHKADVGLLSPNNIQSYRTHQHFWLGFLFCFCNTWNIATVLEHTRKQISSLVTPWPPLHVTCIYCFVANWNPEPPGRLVQGSLPTTWFLMAPGWLCMFVAGCVWCEPNPLSKAVLSPCQFKMNLWIHPFCVSLCRISLRK